MAPTVIVPFQSERGTEQDYPDAARVYPCRGAPPRAVCRSSRQPALEMSGQRLAMSPFVVDAVPRPGEADHLDRGMGRGKSPLVAGWERRVERIVGRQDEHRYGDR